MRTTIRALIGLSALLLYGRSVDAAEVCSADEPLSPDQATIGRAYDEANPDSPPMIPGATRGENIDAWYLRPTFERLLAIRFCNASAIVSGTIRSRRFVLTPARKYIFGDYSLEVDEVFKTYGGIAVGSTIRVVRPGGAVCTSAGRFEVVRNGFSAPEVGKRYLLYLKYDPASGRYRISDGGNYLLDGPVAADNTVTAQSIETEEAKDSAAALLTAVRGSSVTCAN